VDSDCKKADTAERITNACTFFSFDLSRAFVPSAFVFGQIHEGGISSRILRQFDGCRLAGEFRSVGRHEIAVSHCLYYPSLVDSYVWPAFCIHAHCFAHVSVSQSLEHAAPASAAKGSRCCATRFRSRSPWSCQVPNTSQRLTKDIMKVRLIRWIEMLRRYTTPGVYQLPLAVCLVCSSSCILVYPLDFGRAL
jgi:hypothetical protein